jgi:hypothetical protein
MATPHADSQGFSSADGSGNPKTVKGLWVRRVDELSRAMGAHIGGFFHGKNFVFDERIAVGSARVETVGTCGVCEAACDDYRQRCRCHKCRMLVLVCDRCRANSAAAALRCELCSTVNDDDDAASSGDARCDGDASSGALRAHDDAEPGTVQSDKAARRAKYATPASTHRPVRILCLHGFRSTGKKLRGRMMGFARKLKVSLAPPS